MTSRVVHVHPSPARALAPWRAVAVAVLACLLLAACAPSSRSPGAEITSAIPIADVFGPRFELVAEETAILRFDPPGAGAGLGVTVATIVRNPNEFPITVDRIEYGLLLRGQVVARAVLEPQLVLDPGASQPLSWRVDADLTSQRELWRPVVDAFAGTPLAFAVQGNVRFTSQTYAFTTGPSTLIEGSLLATEAVAPPRLRLDGRASRMTVVRADAPVVSLVLYAANAGDVGYFLTGRDLVLELNGEVVSTLDLGPVPVPAGETARVDLLFILDRARLAPAAKGAVDLALWGEQAGVRLRGAFAYDVLGVDSYLADIGEGLVVTLPASQLPNLPRPPGTLRTAAGGAAQDGADEGAGPDPDDGEHEGERDDADDGAGDGDEEDPSDTAP